MPQVHAPRNLPAGGQRSSKARRSSKLDLSDTADDTTGSTDDLPGVLKALEGVYGAFVNTDSFTIGEAKEIFTGIRIFELAKQTGTLKHYVWSGLDYSFKVSLYLYHRSKS